MGVEAKSVVYSLAIAAVLFTSTATEVLAAKKHQTKAPHPIAQKDKSKSQKPKNPPPIVSPEALAKVVKKTKADLDNNLAASLQRGMLHELLPLFEQIADLIGGVTKWDLAATSYKETKCGGDQSPKARYAVKTKNYLQNDPSALISQAKEHKEAILKLLAKGPLIYKGVDYARRSTKGQPATPMDHLVEALDALEKCKGAPSGTALAKARNNIAHVPVYAILIGAYHHKAALDRASENLKDKTLASEVEENGFYMGWNIGADIEYMAKYAGKPASNYISHQKIYILGGSSSDTNEQLFKKAAKAHSVRKQEIREAVEGKNATPQPVTYAPMPTLQGKLRPSAYVASWHLDFKYTL